MYVAWLVVRDKRLDFIRVTLTHQLSSLLAPPLLSTRPVQQTLAFFCLPYPALSCLILPYEEGGLH